MNDFFRLLQGYRLRLKTMLVTKQSNSILQTSLFASLQSLRIKQLLAIKSSLMTLQYYRHIFSHFSTLTLFSDSLGQPYFICKTRETWILNALFVLIRLKLQFESPNVDIRFVNVAWNRLQVEQHRALGGSAQRLRFYQLNNFPSQTYSDKIIGSVGKFIMNLLMYSPVIMIWKRLFQIRNIVQKIIARNITIVLS